MLTLQVTPAAADLIIASLRQLPHNQVHDLVIDLFNQCKAQQAAAAPETVEETAEEVKTGGTD